MENPYRISVNTTIELSEIEELLKIIPLSLGNFLVKDVKYVVHCTHTFDAGGGYETDEISKYDFTDRASAEKHLTKMEQVETILKRRYSYRLSEEECWVLATSENAPELATLFKDSES